MPSAKTESSSTPVITAEQLLHHWQGHRGLTRRVIDAFPEKDLFNHSIGGMRTFAQLTMEFIGMAVPTLQGVITREWPSTKYETPETKAGLLELWDSTTDEINRLWPAIPAARFQETDTAFGQWEMPIHALIFYIIDNEIHHRGQGYVYLRSLGIEPPPFYERAFS
ncbi:MAG: DinB family protein [Gemmatimonadales bacterium]